ncbi:hypothetical protein FNF28_03422 [Cafeteria roenbergensis]|uniref:Uncharacterized protein n=1 Tax=Cafeteria roenbergensis TaxID=33653 RepID=A0A5A8DKC5_CAFRO|nr:hypothetical protein FNF28_03422 [Cafeteria roenbergensis]
MPPSARAHPGSASTAAASSGQAAASRRSALGSILKARVLQATSDSEVIAGVLTAQGHAWAGKGPPRKGGEYAMARRLSHDTLASQNSDKGPASSADGPAAGGSDPHRADGASRPDRLRVDGAGSSNGLDMPGAVLRGQSDGSAGLFMPSSSAGAVEASSDGQGADAHPRHSIRFAELHPIAGAIAEELASALTAVMGNVLQAARVIAREDGSDILSAHHIATAVEQKPTLQKLFGTGWRMSLSARVGPIVAAVRVAALPTLRLARGGVVRKGVVRQGTLLRLYRDMYAVRERLEAGPPAAEGAALRQVLAALLKVAATAERHALGETVEEYAVGWGRWVGPSWGDGSYAGALTAVPQAGGAGGAAPAAAPGGGIWAQTRAQMPAPPMLSQSRVFGPAPAPARDVFADAFAAAGSSEDRSPASSSRRGRAPPSSGSMSGAAHSNPKPKDHVLVGGEDTAWQYGAWRLARRACVIRDSFFAPDVAPALAEALFVQTEAALASAASMMELEVAAAASSAMVLAASRQRLAVTAAAEQLAEADCKAATTAATAAAAATGAPDDAAAKAGAAAAPARGDPAAPQAPPRSHRRAGSGPSSGIASVAALSAKVGAPVGSADGRDSVAARSPRAATARLSDIGRSPVVGASKLGASQSDGASSFSGGPTPPSQPVADPASSAVAAPEPALPFPEPAAGAAALSPAVGASVAGGADAPSAETPEASTIRGATRPPAGSITEESDVGIGRRARRPSVQLAKAGTPERVVNSPMLSARASREPAGSTPGQLAARQGDGTKGATDGGNWGSFGRERSGSQVAGVFGEDVLSEAALEMMPDLGMGDGSPRTPSVLAAGGSSPDHPPAGPGAPSSVSKPVSLHGGSRSNGFGSATSLASTVRTSAFERLQLAASLLEGEEEEAEAPDLFPWQGPQGETLAQASARARALGAFTGNAASSSSSSHSSAGSAKLSSGSSSAAPSCMSTPATGLVASGLPSRTRLAPPALGSDGPVASAPSTGGAWKWEHATALGAQWRTGAKRECPSGRHSHKSSQDSVDSATTPFTGVGSEWSAAPAGKVARFSGGGPGSPSPGKPVGHAATPDAGRSQRRSRRLSDTAFDSSSSPPSHVAVELPSQTHTTDLSSTDDALSPVDPAGYSMSACATPALGTESTPFDTGVTTLWARVLPPLAPFQVSHRLPPGYDSRLVARSPTSPDYDDSDEHDGEADGADDAAERERPVRRNDESSEEDEAEEPGGLAAVMAGASTPGGSNRPASPATVGAATPKAGTKPAPGVRRRIVRDREAGGTRRRRLSSSSLSPTASPRPLGPSAPSPSSLAWSRRSQLARKRRPAPLIVNPQLVQPLRLAGLRRLHATVAALPAVLPTNPRHPAAALLLVAVGAVDVSAVLGTLIPGASAAVGGSDGLLPSGSDGSGRSGLDALVNGPGAHGPHFGPAGRQRAGGGRANPADDAPTIGRALAAGRHEEPPALGRTGSTSDLQRAVPARRGSAVGAPRKSSRLAQTGPYGIAKPAAPAGPVAPAADGDSASGRSSSGGVGGSLSHAPASADPGDGATSPIQGVGGSQPGTVFRHNAHRAVGRTDWRVHTSQPHTVGSRRTDASGQASGAAESVLSSSPHAARLGPGRARASTADSGLGVSDPFASRSAGPATSVRRHVQGGGAADPAAACGPAPSPAPSPQSGQAADQPGRDGEQDAAGSAGSFVRRGSQGDRTATASHVTTDASTGQSSGGGSVVRGRNDSEDLGSRALRGSLLALGSTVDASSASTATAADDADDGVVRAGALPASDFGKRPSKAGRAASDAGSTGSGSSNSRGTDHVPQVPQLTGTWTHNAGDSGGHVVGSAQSRAGGQVVSILKRVVSTGREEEERAEEVSRQAALELLDGDHDVLDTRDEDDMLDDDEAGGSVNGSAGTASTMEQAGAMQSLYAAADQRSPLGIDAELPSGSQAASSRSESPGASDHFEERSRSSGSRSGSHIAMSASALGLSEADDLRAGVRETRHSSGSGNSLLDALGGVEFSSRARHVPAALAGSSQHPALPAPHGRRGSAGSSGSDGPLCGRRRGPRIQPSGSQTTKARRSGNALVDRLGGRPGSGAGRVGAARDKARSMVAAGAAPGIAVSAAARRQGLLGQPDARVAHSLGQVPAGLMRGTRAVGSPGVLQPAGLSAGLVAELSAGSDLAPAGPGTAGAESSGMSLSSEETRRTQSQFQSGPGGGGAKPGLGSAPLSIRVSGPKREVTLAASSPEPQLHRRRLLASQEVPRLVRANSRDSEAASDGGGDVVSEAVDAVMQEVGKSPRHRRHSVGEMASPRAGPSASPRGVASATASAGLRIGGQPAVSAAVRASRAGLGGVDSPLRTATSGPASSLGRPSAGEGSEGNSVGSLALTPAFAAPASASGRGGQPAHGISPGTSEAGTTYSEARPVGVGNLGLYDATLRTSGSMAQRALGASGVTVGSKAADPSFGGVVLAAGGPVTGVSAAPSPATEVPGTTGGLFFPGITVQTDASPRDRDAADRVGSHGIAVASPSRRGTTHMRGRVGLPLDSPSQGDLIGFPAGSNADGTWPGSIAGGDQIEDSPRRSMHTQLSGGDETSSGILTDSATLGPAAGASSRAAAGLEAHSEISDDPTPSGLQRSDSATSEFAQPLPRGLESLAPLEVLDEPVRLAAKYLRGVVCSALRLPDWASLREAGTQAPPVSMSERNRVVKTGLISSGAQGTSKDVNADDAEWTPWEQAMAQLSFRSLRVAQRLSAARSVVAASESGLCYSKALFAARISRPIAALLGLSASRRATGVLQTAAEAEATTLLKLAIKLPVHAMSQGAWRITGGDLRLVMALRWPATLGARAALRSSLRAELLNLRRIVAGGTTVPSSDCLELYDPASHATRLEWAGSAGGQAGRRSEALRKAVAKANEAGADLPAISSLTPISRWSKAPDVVRVEALDSWEAQPGPWPAIIGHSASAGAVVVMQVASSAGSAEHKAELASLAWERGHLVFSSATYGGGKAATRVAQQNGSEQPGNAQVAVAVPGV